MPFSKDKAFCKIKYNSWVTLYPLSLLTTLSPFECITFKSCSVNTTQVVIKVVITKELIKSEMFLSCFQELELCKLFVFPGD